MIPDFSMPPADDGPLMGIFRRILNTKLLLIARRVQKLNDGGDLAGFSGTSSGTNTGDQTSVSGNAGTATALQNARTIAGVSFDGTANIGIPVVNLSDVVSPTGIAYSAGDYASDVGTWTVDLGDIYDMKYAIFGKVMLMWVRITTTTTATAPTILKIKVPAGKTIAYEAFGAGVWNTTAAGYNQAIIRAVGGATSLEIHRNDLASAFPNVTNDLGVWFTIPFAIQ